MDIEFGGRDMPVAAVSFYRGGTVEDVAPLARRMKAVLRKYDLGYEVSRMQTPGDLGDWVVIVRYPDWAAYETALEAFAQDAEHRHVVAEISQVVTFVRREMVVVLDL